ncbi:DJ-1/PfpI family protein [Amycolatopsis rhabdoformis]|uniref:DJ-1/PfpI family protein n=1 Tax=Amycolatopsis rhabdoformis TaxID=1448059 RepID=A0ABZ1IH54_9PSEU|nr:DJ-1/PfpI family protein [Amycolatopsis rhabdoformis]WSE33592.1 DJ-1/PfpI family protein [Amycolatopsis rhabdoformis]
MTASHRPVRVDLVLFDGCDDLDVFGPLEALGIARKGGAALEVATVTLAAQESVVTNHGVRIVPAGVYRPGADYLVVPGGGAGGTSGVGAQLASGAWYGPLAEAMASGTTLVSVCTGALLLAGAGVLGGRAVTTHHASLERLRGMGATVVTERVVDAGDVISAGGITSGIDLGLWLVERIAGRAAADRAAKVLEYERFRPAAVPAGEGKPRA